MTTEEILLQIMENLNQMTTDISELKEGQKQMSADIAEIKEDIIEMKEEAHITRSILNRHGEILEQMVKDLEPLNLLNVKYE